MSAIKTGQFLIVTASLLTGLSLGTPASAAIKCWTNNEGVRECGESVPP